MKNRTIIGIVCIVLAVTVLFGVTPLVAKMSAGKITVVQVNKPITEGKQITAADVVKVEIGRHGVTGSVITDEKAVVGKYAKSDLYPEVNLTAAMITADADNAESVLRTVDGNHVAVSVTVPSFAAALSSKLENGDIVSVIVTDKDGTRIPKELTYVRVITTTTNKGIDQDRLQPDENGNVELPATVTLYVTPGQAKLLAQYEVGAEMHFSLVYRGDTKTAQKYLNAQEDALLESDGEADE